MNVHQNFEEGGVAAAMVKQKINGDDEKRRVRFGSEEVIPCNC